jgi:hypothetical protein
MPRKGQHARIDHPWRVKKKASKQGKTERDGFMVCPCGRREEEDVAAGITVVYRRADGEWRCAACRR